MIVIEHVITSLREIERAEAYCANCLKTTVPPECWSEVESPLPEFSRWVKYDAATGRADIRYISAYRGEVDGLRKQIENNINVLQCISLGQAHRRKVLLRQIIVSLPRDCTLTDEEILRCGCDFVRRANLNGGTVIYMHAFPAEDDEHNPVSGQQKHLHILEPSYVSWEDYRLNAPAKKNHNIYDLRAVADQLSIDYGLPLIRTPDMKKNNSYFEARHEQDADRWKQNLKKHIDIFSAFSRDWNTYVEQMTQVGYTVKETRKNVKYATADGNSVTDTSLGREYCKDALSLRWIRQTHAAQEIADLQISGEIADLIDFATSHASQTKVIVPCGPEWLNPRKHVLVPLSGKVKGDSDALQSYFDDHSTYKIVDDETGSIVREASGLAIRWCIEYLQNVERVRADAIRATQDTIIKAKSQPLTRNQRKAIRAYEKRQRWYKKNYTTHHPDGSRRGFLELLFVFALVCTGKDYLLFLENLDLIPPEGAENELFSAPVNRNIQRVIDAYAIIHAEHVTSLDDLTRKLDSTHNHLRWLSAQYAAVMSKKDDLAQQYAAAKCYLDGAGILAHIAEIEDPAAKNAYIESHKADIAAYEEAKTILRRHHTPVNADTARKVIHEKTSLTHKEAELKMLLTESRQQYYRLNQLQRDAHCCPLLTPSSPQKKTVFPPAQNHKPLENLLPGFEALLQSAENRVGTPSQNCTFPEKEQEEKQEEPKHDFETLLQSAENRVGTPSQNCTFPEEEQEEKQEEEPKQALEALLQSAKNRVSTPSFSPPPKDHTR